MTDPAKRQPWWKKKRWLVAAVVWLVLPGAYVAAYRVLMRPVVTVFWTEGMSSLVEAGYPHPTLATVFAPAEWVHRRVRPGDWRAI